MLYNIPFHVYMKYTFIYEIYRYISPMSQNARQDQSINPDSYKYINSVSFVLYASKYLVTAIREYKNKYKTSIEIKKKTIKYHLLLQCT